jgi:hypothetical protein
VKTNTTYVPGVLGRLAKFRPAPTTHTGTPPPQIAPITLKQMTQSIGQPPPGTPHAAPAKGASVFDRSLLAEAASGFDPRTPTGRRNLAGATGALAATAAVVGTAPVSLPVAATVGALGAAGGGMLAESGEQIVGTRPPSEMAVLTAGAEQGLYEGGGHVATRTMLWPLRRIAGSRVGTQARAWLGEQKTALEGTRRAVATELDEGLQVAQDLVRRAKTAGADALESVRRTGRTRVRDAADTARSGIETAEALGKARTTDAAAPFESLVGMPPPTVEAGQQAATVLRGPVAAVRDRLGAQVEEAAATGPDLDWRPIRDLARRMVARALPGRPAELAPDVAALANRPHLTAAERSTFLARLQEAGVSVNESHPLPGLLGQIESLPDRIPFSEAHKVKRLLDEAVVWDRTAKRQLEGMTKGVRIALRNAMAGHEPYNQATAGYESIVKLFSKDVRSFLRVADESPTSLLKMLRPDEPVKAGMLRELLVDRAAQGGQAEAGQRAWDTVRAAWTRERIIRGDIGKLGARLSTLSEHPEFRSVLFGDETGQQVLENLKLIDSAYRSALEQGTRELGAARAAGRGTVRAATEAAEQETATVARGVREAVGQRSEEVRQLQGQVRASKAPTEAEQMLDALEARFKSSGLKRIDPAEMADVLRGAGLGIKSIWGSLSILRLLSRTPKGADLVEFAAYSTPNTQRFVRALTGPEPAIALANLLRMSGIGADLIDHVGAPPPARAQGPAPSVRRVPAVVGAPPP